ncbi:MAG: tetratricopeptide repeat protein [Gammaproteobacteria bacterium]|nr:tetratricopeptide repeat protein [Gammaproteobacteria bacterium]
MTRFIKPPQQRGESFRWLLFALLFAPIASTYASDITGTWEGAFSCADVDYTWQIGIDETASNRFVGQLVFTRVSDGAKGAHKVAGAYKPKTGRVSLNPKGWIQKMPGRAHLGFRGTLGPNTEIISGQFIDRTCGSFEMERTSTDVAALEFEPAAPAAPRARPTVHDPDQIEDMSPEEVAALYEKGMANFLLPRSAIGIFSQVVAVRPEWASGYRGRAWASLVEGDNDRAIADFNKVLSLQPDDSEGYRGRAWARLQSGDYEAARDDFGELIRRARSKAEGYAGSGLANYFSGDLLAARAEFRASMRFEPRFNDAMVYTRSGKFLAAPATLPVVVASSDPSVSSSQQERPADQAMRSDMSTRLDDWRKYRKVLVQLRRQTKQNPDDLYAWLAIAVVQYRALDDDPGVIVSIAAGAEARRAFDRAVEIDPESIDALMSRAMMRSTRRFGNDPAGAIADLTEVIRLKPDEVEAYFRRAFVYAASHESQSLAKAVSDCESALALIPDDPMLPRICDMMRGRHGQAARRELAQMTYEQGVKDVRGLALLLLGAAIVGMANTPGCEACDLAAGMAGYP